MSGFQKAVRRQAKLRLALVGPSGSGKTFSALKLASYLASSLPTADKTPIAVIDTEFGSASKYAAPETPDPEAGLFAFDVMQLTAFHPRKNYVEAIKAAEEAGYEIIIVDSLSHAWIGKEGGLELHDKAVKAQKTQNSYTAWADVTPHHAALVEAMVQCKAHLIVTMRSKTEYVQDKDDRGRSRVRKVGMAPVQRDGLEYEFDVVGDLDVDHTFVISKTRCSALNAAVISNPGRELALTLKQWLGSGVVAPPVEKPAPAPARAKPAPAAPAPTPDPAPEKDDGEVIEETEARQIETLLIWAGKSWADVRKGMREKTNGKDAPFPEMDAEAQTADLTRVQAKWLSEKLQKVIDKKNGVTTEAKG